MHINFSEYYYSVTGIYDYDSWQLSESQYWNAVFY